MKQNEFTSYVEAQRDIFLAEYPEADDEMFSAFCDQLMLNYELEQDEWEI